MIPDVFIKPLEIVVEGPLSILPILTEKDHLLHRIARMEFMIVKTNDQPKLRLHRQADEVWVLVDGEVELRWLDLRPQSSTRGRVMDHKAASPILFLVPFGVAFGYKCEAQAEFLRLTSEADPITQRAELLAWNGDRIE